MKEISEGLFHWLCVKCIKNGEDIGLFVNKMDNNIYLIIDRNVEAYFVVNGRVSIMADGAFDKSRSDDFLIVRNARTKILKSISSREVKRMIDYASLDVFVDELEEAVSALEEKQRHENSESIKKNFEFAIIEFEKLIEWAQKYTMFASIGPGEDVFAYANRMSDPRFIRNRRIAKEIIERKNYIEALWRLALYRPKSLSFYEHIIKTCIKNTLLEFARI